MSTGITLKNADALNTLKNMIARGQSLQAAFARIYPLYQQLQTQRFQTENSSESEDDPWPSLNSVYAKYKPRRYGGGPRRKSKKRAAGTWNSYPGRGSKMMVGTGMLAGAVIGPSTGSPFTDGTSAHTALFMPNSMVISVNESGENPDGNPFDYPHFAAVHRPFFTFGDTSMDQFRDTITQYILGDD